MKIRTHTVENLKTLLIVVLIASAILLLYFLWRNETFDDLRSPIDFLREAQGSNVPANPSDLIVPENIVAHLEESESYKVSTDRTDVYWKEFVGQFRQFSLSDDIYVEEIKKEQWEKARAMTSLTATFAYDIDFLSFCSLFDISRPSQYNMIETVTALRYCEATVSDASGESVKKSIIIYDGKKDKYYGLASEENLGSFSGVIQTMTMGEDEPGSQAEASAEPDYYPISKLSLAASNDCLIPLDDRANSSYARMQRFGYHSELQSEGMEGGETDIQETAKLFFGQNFDFIRRVQETNDTTVFIYGYGEKRLSAQKNGSFEYREEFSGGDTPESFAKALRTCAKYIDTHGGLQNLRDHGVSAYVKDVKAIEEKSKPGYRITFGLKLDGMPVYYENEETLIVDTVGGQVIYYKRYIILPAWASNMQPQNQDAGQLMAASDVLLKNNLNGSIIMMLESGGEEPEKPEGSEEEDRTEGADVRGTAEAKSSEAPEDSAADIEAESFDAVVNSISEVRSGYMQAASEGMLLPVWVFTAGSTDMYFDLYTGEPYGFSKHKSAS